MGIIDGPPLHPTVHVGQGGPSTGDGGESRTIQAATTPTEGGLERSVVLKTRTATGLFARGSFPVTPDPTPSGGILSADQVKIIVGVVVGVGAVICLSCWCWAVRRNRSASRWRGRRSGATPTPHGGRPRSPWGPGSGDKTPSGGWTNPPKSGYRRWPPPSQDPWLGWPPRSPPPAQRRPNGPNGGLSGPSGGLSGSPDRGPSGPNGGNGDRNGGVTGRQNGDCTGLNGPRRPGPRPDRSPPAGPISNPPLAQHPPAQGPPIQSPPIQSPPVQNPPAPNLHPPPPVRNPLIRDPPAASPTTQNPPPLGHPVRVPSVLNPQVQQSGVQNSFGRDPPTPSRPIHNSRTAAHERMNQQATHIPGPNAPVTAPQVTNPQATNPSVSRPASVPADTMRAIPALEPSVTDPPVTTPEVKKSPTPNPLVTGLRVREPSAGKPPPPKPPATDLPVASPRQQPVETLPNRQAFVTEVPETGSDVLDIEGSQSGKSFIRSEVKEQAPTEQPNDPEPEVLDGSKRSDGSDGHTNSDSSDGSGGSGETDRAANSDAAANRYRSPERMPPQPPHVVPEYANGTSTAPPPWPRTYVTGPTYLAQLSTTDAPIHGTDGGYAGPSYAMPSTRTHRHRVDLAYTPAEAYIAVPAPHIPVIRRPAELYLSPYDQHGQHGYSQYGYIQHQHGYGQHEHAHHVYEPNTDHNDMLGYYDEILNNIEPPHFLRGLATVANEPIRPPKESNRSRKRKPPPARLKSISGGSKFAKVVSQVLNNVATNK